MAQDSDAQLMDVNTKDNVLDLRATLSKFAYSMPSNNISRTPIQTPRYSSQKESKTEKNSPLKSPSPSPTKRIRSVKNKSNSLLETPTKKQKRGYDPKIYAHLNLLQDYLDYELDVMFVGINPGYRSAEVGHHFANPTNHFWRCLHQSDLTNRLVPPSEDSTLPSLFSLGLTNLVDRPSTEEAELSKKEMSDSVPTLMAKIARFRPRIVCFVGRGIWLIVEKTLKASDNINKTSNRQGSSSKTKATGQSTTNYGLQPYTFLHANSESNILKTLFFVSPCTSGRVVSHQLSDKVKLFTQLRHHVQEHKEGKFDTETMLSLST